MNIVANIHVGDRPIIATHIAVEHNGEMYLVFGGGNEDSRPALKLDREKIMEIAINQQPGVVSAFYTGELFLKDMTLIPNDVID
jgi:hypothetical protein